jgi:hypothetical protein
VSHLEKLREHYLDQPCEVSLETYAKCNAACTFCPYPTLERIGEKMSDALIDRLIDEMSGWEVPFYFSPFKVNEPLLDKRLFWVCRQVEDKTKALLRIFTNGSPLTQKRIDEIADLERVAHLWISLNEHRPDEYEALMGIKFDVTAKRLDNLHEQDFPHPVVLSTVGFPNEDFRRYCFDRWPKFESTAIQRSEWLGYTDSQVDVVPDTPCGRWFELSIMATGKVALCCMDGEGEFAIGDVNERTMLEVYNAPHWRERRENLLSRHDIHPCNTCTY